MMIDFKDRKSAQADAKPCGLSGVETGARNVENAAPVKWLQSVNPKGE